jgi:hypothetical protein
MFCSSFVIYHMKSLYRPKDSSVKLYYVNASVFLFIASSTSFHSAFVCLGLVLMSTERLKFVWVQPSSFWYLVANFIPTRAFYEASHKNRYSFLVYEDSCYSMSLSAVDTSEFFLVTNLFRVRITYIHIHTYHWRLIPEGVKETSQIFCRDPHALLKWLSFEKYCRHGWW